VLRHTEESDLYRYGIKSDGSITRTQMINDLGFKVVTLFTSSFMINARDVEDALQRRFQGLPLGRRLWRSPDQGAKFEMPDEKVNSVGIVYSDQIVPMIKAGKIEVCDSAPSFFEDDEDSKMAPSKKKLHLRRLSPRETLLQALLLFSKRNQELQF